MTNKKNQQLERGMGILLPISALPSPYGIGTLGKEGYEFADFLKRTGCKYWQVLPVGPTSFGDSPYQSFSAFAGNPYFIDLDYLVEEGLLTKEELDKYQCSSKKDDIDYAELYKERFKVLRKAYEKSNHKDKNSYKEFCDENSYWIHNYSLYMAIKTSHNNKEWSLWEDDIKYRKKNAILKYETELKNEIDFWKFCQYKFKSQWDNLKEYVNGLGIQIIGDIPLYVALDSSDVWVDSDLFELDERRKPIHIAGVPPDNFSEDGQRWGNPLYRWDVMERSNFNWWRERMKVNSMLYDVIRIDHFIGIVNYYSIPEESKTAAIGSWVTGPGKKLTDAIGESIGNAKIIAEDLGVLTPNVKELIETTGYPGMKIIEFGLYGPWDNDYLPHNFKKSNIVAYTGTHDNETLVGFLRNRTNEELESLYLYFNVTTMDELPDAIIRSLYGCIADVTIVQMQDLLKLDNNARMNFPSTVGSNWKWRLLKEQYNEINEENLLLLARIYNRYKAEDNQIEEDRVL